ncbi:MAG: preprotein translocase subunit YajC [Actinobacteria bacterium]|nr:preprotein translocase subunit YajC [Actinomycetota bacterium]
MNLFLSIIAMASSGSSDAKGNPMGFFLPIILIFAIMYLLIFRPQAKKQKEHRKMLEVMQKGDRVVTAGGIYGTIAGIKEKEGIVILKIDNNVKIEITRSSIARTLTGSEQKK